MPLPTERMGDQSHTPWHRHDATGHWHRQAPGLTRDAGILAQKQWGLGVTLRHLVLKEHGRVGQISKKIVVLGKAHCKNSFFL